VGGEDLRHAAAAAFLACGLGAAAWAADGEDGPPAVGPDWSLAVNGHLANYGVYYSHPFFGRPERGWLETSARLSTSLEYETLTVTVGAIGVRTTGRDPNGTGTRPAGAPPQAARRSTSPDFDLDQAYVQLAQLLGQPLKATLGRQYITIGSQFLIGDGVYDGFSPHSQQAVYHNPRRSFDAGRLEWDAPWAHVDSFVYNVDPTWDAAGGDDGVLGGVDVSRPAALAVGTYAAGLFYRTSPSKKDNDMAVGNVRVEQHLPLLPDAYVSGEGAGEFLGTCRNAVYCTRTGQDMSEYAWHAEVGYQATRPAWKPFVEAGYVEYSKDFTPIAPGFSDWGKWYLGNTIDWIVFGTNTRVVRADLGFWPSATTKLRCQYFNTREATPSGTSTGGTLSDEVNLILEWYPTEWLWVNVLGGWARPGSALARSGLMNPFAAINSGAGPVGTHDTLHAVLAVGIDYSRKILPWGNGK